MLEFTRRVQAHAWCYIVLNWISVFGALWIGHSQFGEFEIPGQSEFPAESSF